MGPANSFPSNPALPPPANRRQGRRAPLPSHVTVTVTGAGRWGGPVGLLAGGRLCLWLPRLGRVLVVASQGCTAIYYESYRYSYFFSSASSYSFQACSANSPWRKKTPKLILVVLDRRRERSRVEGGDGCGWQGLRLKESQDPLSFSRRQNKLVPRHSLEEASSQTSQ